MVSSGTALAVVQAGKPVTALAFSHQSGRALSSRLNFAIGDSDGTIQVFEKQPEQRSSG
jgi:hypothetical protein